MKSAMAQEQPRQVARVVVVDDDELLLRALARLLSNPGHEVFSCTDATIALEHVRAGRADVLISDIMMPGWSGIDLLREVRRHNLDLPVILMTGAPDLTSAVAAVELGAISYLTKPIDASTFVATVERAIALGRVAAMKREALTLNGADGHLLGDRVALEDRFDHAVDQLWMAFQPIVSLGEQRAVAYEALLRTREPTLGNPMAFLSAAERLGAVHVLGRKIRNSVVVAAEKAPLDVDIFVNLHPLDLLDPQLVEPAASLAALAPRIVLEITERASLEDIPDVSSRVATLRALGFRIAVDDLGAGYAGLTSLTSLQPDVVKLDMSLVRGCDTDVRRQRVLSSLLRLCRELEMSVVTEGIETTGERDVIAGFGGDLLQGYLYARPSQGFVVPRFEQPE